MICRSSGVNITGVNLLVSQIFAGIFYFTLIIFLAFLGREFIRSMSWSRILI